ncbi:hypothetical protein QUG92_11270 [Curtobacterium sp. RHCKG23]|uniref:Flagellar protein FliT n=1 Tax=Curtobacterium citri TaxID=3055139 RepID=A0ABT7T7X9_9MICO|nr:hypothetical protein [Curtobacterium citri]MDM7885684.1 hypothetical protein [Curtobacterium citri]
MSPETPALAPGSAPVHEQEAAAHDAWVTTLDALERDLSADATTTWTEPTGLGPVPRDLVGRASRLLAAQRDRAADLETERRRTLEHLGALRRVAETDEPRGSVYLDASA